MAEIRDSEMEVIEFAFEVYGEKDGLDGTQIGAALRALQLNPSLETLEKLGATKKKGEKKLKIEEFVPIYVECKKEIKDQGCYEDFIECLKLYDKDENGKMLLGELSHALLTLGEKLTESEVNILFTDCMGEEDDDGQIDYDPFLRKMCDRV